MKALVTGARGMLGQALVPVLEQRGHEVLGLSREQADVTRPEPLAAAACAFRPDWIFHLAAFTRVDDCESDPERARQVNAAGALHAARAAAGSGAALLALSTDYVFDGAGTRPYRETDPARPVSAYGRSKWEGEEAVRATLARHLIVRTAWLYGRGGANFVDTIVRRARTGEGLRVVDDQRGAPTWTEDLARGLVALAETNVFGTCHLTNAGECTWHELAAEVLERTGCRVPLERIDSATLQRPARRPSYSVLSLERFEHVTGRRMRPWREAVQDYLESQSAAAGTRREEA